MKALIVIDYTVDFVVGKLPCGEPAIAIEQRVCELTEQFVNQQDYVVMAVDLHEAEDPFHPESKLFPPHNIRDTEGRALYGELKSVYNHRHNHMDWLDKTRYSAFCGTDLELKLRARGVHELHLAGVCTDICVLHTAVDAYNKGFALTIHADAVASFDHEGHAWALRHYEQTLGAKVVRDWSN
ncbi:cysteine hydrolase family protein [Paenibacillus roseipurpureus]|uniref:Isochorismatase family cysteine hydrolase n=1 Tax=Paenibacillus roseopurpureus TaxID=2918901 RepID=A0AA96LRG1_9BACL|nr:isochorismatase family cysteine hydrolase [Paenibacillus sp. MBLB1832]WNR43435.1 isochorismatase family cysteine hydrolase [Paenibacillus sp. MBLB1832]